ncbi:MAG: sel1 repeat family protein [Alphaproteobacteria bacterium]|nr:sel1 repeat family protein [Alphaproteobacteria bacterium]
MLRPTLLVLAFLSVFAAPAYAGFEEGRDAYNRKDWEKTILELRPLAETGDDRAMLLIGNMYYYGYGVVQDYQEALSLYWRAAIEKNNPDAMLAVAAMYTSATGVDQNLHTAGQWFLRAAQLGDQAGAYFYATILFRGNKSATDDIKPDFYNSYKWFRICAKGTQDPKYQQAAAELAAAIAKKKLSAEAITKADKEAAEWKPLSTSNLGPPPKAPASVQSE